MSTHEEQCYCPGCFNFAKIEQMGEKHEFWQKWLELKPQIDALRERTDNDDMETMVKKMEMQQKLNVLGQANWEYVKSRVETLAFILNAIRLDRQLRIANSDMKVDNPLFQLAAELNSMGYKVVGVGKMPEKPPKN